MESKVERVDKDMHIHALDRPLDEKMKGGGRWSLLVHGLITR